uniref:condensation domain-containing protein n=1 Tax=Staphylococcus haemolyticus TaxID=1283 RepID=UPI00214D6923
NDFTLNFPVSDRLPVSDDIDNIVGDFTNTLLVPYKVDKNLTLEEKGAVLQKEIWDALDNRLFTGVEVLRELSRRNRNGKEPLMPVVLTSLLGHPKRHDVSLLGEEVYGVSQTPQVTLDVQIRESEGDLIFQLDCLTNAIKPTVVKDMFEMFSKLLNDLSEDVSSWKKKTLSLLPDYQRKQRELINSTEVTVPDIDLKKLLLNKLIERPNEICLIHKNYKYS